MDFLLFFDKINLASEGRKTFFDIHKRAGDSVFANEVRAAREAFDKSDDAFAEEIVAFQSGKIFRLNISIFTYTLYLRKKPLLFLKGAISLRKYSILLSLILLSCAECASRSAAFTAFLRIFTAIGSDFRLWASCIAWEDCSLSL